MANAILGFTNLVDAAGTVLSASNPVSGLDAANLSTPIVQQVYRAQSGNGWFQADFGASKSIGVVAFECWRNGLVIGAADTVRLQLDAVTPGAGAVYDSGAGASSIVPAFGYWLAFFATPKTARYVRITIASAASYFQVGRLWAGPALQPTRNFAYGWGREWDDASVVTKAPKSGIRIRNLGPKFRTLSIAFNALASADADSVEDGDVLTGISAQMLVCIDPAAPARKTIIGTPAKASPIVQAQFPVFQKAYTIEEDL